MTGRANREFTRLLSKPYMRSACTFLAKTGLRGLGINADYHLEYSGEEWFLKKLFGTLGSPVCADVGANVGDYTMLCHRLGASVVYAFEPNPAAFSELMTKAHGVSNIQFVQTAVGEAKGTTTLFVPNRFAHSTLASRDVHTTMVAEADGKEISVEMIKLDDFEGTTFDFIKIDVEGYELEVLQGARNILLNTQPVIQFEFNTNHLHRRQNMLDFADALKGYALYRLSANALHPLDPTHYLSHIFAYQNIIGIPAKKSGLRRIFV